nr:hypothetical protein [Deinococcus marmoris]
MLGIDGQYLHTLKESAVEMQDVGPQEGAVAAPGHVAPQFPDQRHESGQIGTALGVPQRAQALSEFAPGDQVHVLGEHSEDHPHQKGADLPGVKGGFALLVTLPAVVLP